MNTLQNIKKIISNLRIVEYFSVREVPLGFKYATIPVTV